VKDKGRGLFAIALIIVVIVLSLLWLLGREHCEVKAGCGVFFSKILQQTPAEIGDTLAGIFGSLAFLAAAIAVVMQSFELNAQREELTLTRKEFEKMADAQAAQTKLMQLQTKELIAAKDAESENRYGVEAKLEYQRIVTYMRERIKRPILGYIRSSDSREISSFTLNKEHSRKNQAGVRSSIEFYHDSEIAAAWQDCFNSLRQASTIHSRVDIPLELTSLSKDLDRLRDWIERSDQLTKQKFSDEAIANLVLDLSEIQQAAPSKIGSPT
jgi:hypothetical protein